MAKLRVTIEVNETGECTAEMEFQKQDLEGTGNTPSEALQSLAEVLALHEQEEDLLGEDVRSGQTVYHFS